eukprot:scaffold581_cov83-Phaeocystis_antarctica.AAC.5
MELFRAFREQTQHAAHIKLSLCAHTRAWRHPKGQRGHARGQVPSRGKPSLQKVESLQISPREAQHGESRGRRAHLPLRTAAAAATALRLHSWAYAHASQRTAATSHGSERRPVFSGCQPSLPSTRPVAWPPVWPPAATSPCALHACCLRARATRSPEPEPEP